MRNSQKGDPHGTSEKGGPEVPASFASPNIPPECCIYIQNLKKLCIYTYLYIYKSASERIRKNAYYEQYFLIQVICSMNAKGQTWNDNIWTNGKNPI